MPELPEVETIRKGLEKYLVGHNIEDIDVRVPKLFEGDPQNIIGGKVVDVRRFGKGLVIDLSNKYSLAIHIKLTGQLVYRDPKTKKLPLSNKVGDEIPNQFTHVIFKLDKEAYLYYNDRRRFGWIKALPKEEVAKMPFFKNMGPEPFRDLDLPKFTEIVLGKGTAIKPLLMDQTKIGGIGNIYANDALNMAKIDPKRPAKTLSTDETKLLFNSIISVMEKGFKYGGASELNFVNALGQEGEYQFHSRVYGKRGKPCPNCGGIIEKTYLGGRGTFFCSKCQK